MKKVQLGGRRGPIKGYALIDDEDAKLIKGRSWYLDSAGYPRSDSPTSVRLHRLILGLQRGDGKEGDHKDGNKLDNRRKNLAIVNHRRNCQNTHTKRELPRGVYGPTPSGRFMAQVKLNNTKYHLGHYDTPEKAGQAAQEKRKALGFHNH